MKKQIQATSVRKLLTALIVLLILAGAAGFYYGLQQVKDFAVTVSHTSADATASAQNVKALQQLKENLAESETLVNKANQLFSTDANYQSQALKDVQKYASEAGLTISNTNFDPQASATTTGLIGAGHTFVISLQSPVDYKKLLQFLDSVEGNLPKMQIVSLDLTRPTSGSANEVVIGDTTIQISTR